MNNQFILTLGTILLTTLLHGQEITKEQIIKFKVKSITTIYNWGDREPTIDYYNEMGDLIKTEVEYKGKSGIARRFVYDSSNLLKEEICLDFKGIEFTCVRHSYDIKDRLIKTEKFSQADRNIEVTTEYEYNESGSRIKMSEEKRTSRFETTYTYSGDKLVKEVTIDLKTNSEEQITYFYNGNGQLIQKKEQDLDKNISITKYSYNQQGKLIRVDDGIAIEYKYNDKGLLESETGPFKKKYKYTDKGLLESETIGGNKKVKYEIGF